MSTIEIDKKKALGKGLASLIPDVGSTFQKREKTFFLCDIEKIVPNTYQPRKIFKKEALDELVDSIKAHGVIQPLIVRPREGRYELIAGERRWRACQKAGLKQVPVVIKEVEGDSPSLEMALIENIQRENLNCIEEAIAYQQLIDQFQLSQDEIARRVGKNRATIANTLRLLKLPAVIREDLSSDKLTMGHARALLSIESQDLQLKLHDEILKRKLSVRETEKRAAEVVRDSSSQDRATSAIASDPNMVALEENLTKRYGTKVRLVGNLTRGFIQITYGSREEFTRIADALLKEPSHG